MALAAVGSLLPVAFQAGALQLGAVDGVGLAAAMAPAAVAQPAMGQAAVASAVTTGRGLADGLLVAMGAVPGAWLRFRLVNHLKPLLPRQHWATAGVNLVACLALGLLLSLGAGCTDLHRLGLLLSVGFLGSFSTFSSFVVELLQALAEGQGGAALRLAGLSVGGGLLALELGRWLGAL